MSRKEKGMEGLVFERKTGAEGDYRLSSSRHSAHYKIIRLVGKGKKVLDVGCGSGYLGEAFKKNGCYVVGIESDRERMALAGKVLDEVFSKDAEKPEALVLPEGSFDRIVFADILEHLKRPDTALLGYKRFLKPGGSIIVSVPNVARIDMRLKMLFGNFTYEDGGITDRTHLRFFTLASLSGLLAAAGYSVATVDSTGLLSGIRALRFLRGITAFQFILEARPVKEGADA